MRTKNKEVMDQGWKSNDVKWRKQKDKENRGDHSKDIEWKGHLKQKIKPRREKQWSKQKESAREKIQCTK